MPTLCDRDSLQLTRTPQSGIEHRLYDEIPHILSLLNEFDDESEVGSTTPSCFHC